MRLPRAVVAGMFAVAALDIIEPIIFSALRGGAPIRVLQAVASGVLGRASYSGGVPAALLGAGLHLFIASVVVIVYWLASRRVPVLTRRPLVCGALYGLAVYAVMTWVVIPMSAIGGGLRMPALPMLLNGLFAHLFCVGIPAALFARAASRDAAARVEPT
jgi:hypothetical protein